MTDMNMLRDKLKVIYHNYADEYNRAIQNSLKVKIETLAPGESIPKAQLFTNEERDAFSDKALGYVQEARKIIDQIREEVEAAKTQAPTEEAMRVVQLLKLKDRVTESDIDLALKSAGENYMTHELIRDIARINEIYGYDEHHLDKLTRSLNQAESSCSKMNLFDAERGNTEPGQVSFFDYYIDTFVK